MSTTATPRYTRGDEVICNGYPGRVLEVKPEGVEVRLASGDVIADPAGFDVRPTREYMREVIRQLGSLSQSERYEAGLLPEDELLTLVRLHVFQPFADLNLSRWATSRGREKLACDLRHRAGCARGAVSVDFEVADLAEASGAEWETIKLVQAAVVTARAVAWPFTTFPVLTFCTHWATCPSCEAELARSVVKISIPWAGHTLVREYLL